MLFLIFNIAYPLLQYCLSSSSLSLILFFIIAALIVAGATRSFSSSFVISQLSFPINSLTSPFPLDENPMSPLLLQFVRYLCLNFHSLEDLKLFRLQVRAEPCIYCRRFATYRV
ncbi:hypothetical protein AVEN_182448-1 [Araneus ventricosus]|uniref:Uncharacterized protein n=1 Tax=Araneus ventricosus TaxID=182803 RepID=A0A4Y2K112_ARAVE|nr:hypothetical protein AVEN_182448-1 [Araneus ventricosus]